jgi:signal transduction histidine kinase
MAVSHQLRNDLCFVDCVIEALQVGTHADGVQQQVPIVFSQQHQLKQMCRGGDWP